MVTTAAKTAGDTDFLRRMVASSTRPPAARLTGITTAAGGRSRPKSNKENAETPPAATRMIPRAITDQRVYTVSRTAARLGLNTLTLIHARAARRQHAGAAGYR